MAQLRIALFNAERDGYSQTFIRDHVTRLPGTVIHLSGGTYNWHYNGQPLLWLPFRVANHFSDRLPPRVTDYARARMDANLTGFLRNQRIDVVLAEFADAALFLFEPCRAANIPLVVHCHGYDVSVRSLVEPRKHLYKNLFDAAAKVVVVSQAMRDRVIELGAPLNRVKVNPCGVDHTLFSPKTSANVEQTLIAVGRFVEKKAPHLTLLAFHLALKSCPGARLVMVGDGPLLDACTQLAKALNLSHAVRFVGKQDHRSVSEMMRASRAFVQHSVTAPNGDSEGSPVAVLEAGAAGLPVIATRHAGIMDTIVEKETGFLVDEYDVEAMAKYMILLLSDAQLASEMGRKGRLRIAEHFSMEGSISVLYKVLQDAANGHSRTTGN